VLADVADTFTDDSAKSSNFAASGSLLSADAPLRRVWLKFAHPMADSNATATLRFYSDVATSKATYVYGAPEGWTESGLSFDSAPALSARVATISNLVVGWNTVSIPLSGQDTSSTISLVLMRDDPAGAEISVRSRERSEKPTLTIPR
jgi:hypothetical protein